MFVDGSQKYVLTACVVFAIFPQLFLKILQGECQISNFKKEKKMFLLSIGYLVKTLTDDLINQIISLSGGNCNMNMSWKVNLILSNEAKAAISSSALNILDIGHSMFDCPEQTQMSPKRMSSMTRSGWPSWLTRISQIWPSEIGSRMTDQVLFT